MTLREIFLSLGSFFANLWNWFIDTDIFVMLGFFIMIISPPYLIYQLAKRKKIGGIIFAIFIFFAWIYFTILFIKTL